MTKFRMSMFIGVVLLAALSLQAKSTSWTGGGDGVSWSSDANWSAGMPVEGDTVVIQPTSVLELSVPEAGVSFGSLQVGGALTLSGGQVTITGAAGTSFKSTAASDVITLNSKFVFTSPNGSALSMPGTWYICGGIKYNDYFKPAGGAVIHVKETPLELQRLQLGSATMYIEVADNALGRVELGSGCVLHVMVDNPWLATNFDYFFMNSANSHVYLHGHDCYATWLILSGPATSSIEADIPATFSFDQSKTDVRPNNNIDLKGPLSLRMGTASLAGSPYIMNAALSSTGGLIVESGVFAFGENGSWRDIAYMRLNGGKVQIPSGKTVTVPALYLDGSEESLADGTYTAVTHPAYIQGEGTILVKTPEVETVALTWNPGKDSGAMSDSGNWTEAPASVPLTSGGLIATFATTGLEATHDGSVAMKGVVFSAQNDFRVAANGLSLGSEGVRAQAGHNYTLDAPMTLTSEQTWDVAAGTKLVVPQAVGALSEECAVEKTGDGEVALGGENTFNGDLLISAGHVTLTNNAALGAGSLTMRKTVTVKQAGGAGLVLPGGTLSKNLRFESDGTDSYKNNTKGLRFEGENVIKGALTVTGTARASLKWGSTVDFDGGVSDGGDFRPFAYGGEGSNPLLRFNAVVGNLPISPTQVDLSYEVASNRVARIEVTRGTIHARVPYAWTRTDAYVNLMYNSMVNLHGNDQIVGTLLLNGAHAGYGVTSGEEGAATLYITQNNATYAARTNTVGDLKGRLNIVMGGPYASIHNCALSTSGDLTVTNGTFKLLENGSWLNGTNFTVTGVSDACKGRLSIASSAALSKHAVIRLGGKGSLELAEGVNLKCEQLEGLDGDGNWKRLTPGTWGATGSGASHIDDVHFVGKGVLSVHGAGLILIVR